MTIEDKVIESVRNKKIYLYGAGIVARRLVHRFRLYDIDLRGVVVTNKEGLGTEYEGLPIYSVDETLPDEKVSIVVAVGVKYYLEVMDLLTDLGCYEVINIPVQYRLILSKLELADIYAKNQKDFYISFMEPNIEGGMGVIRDCKTNNPAFRVIEYNSPEQAVELAKVCNYEYFESLYGKLCVLEHKVRNENEEISQNKTKSIEIYVATSHLDGMKASDKNGFFIPIQVGAALTGIRKGCIADNSGNSISMENANYCECTGLYWIWKNTNGQDYVGLNHYRRRLTISEEDYNALYVNNIDIVLALPQYGSMSVKDFFAGRLITNKDWNLMLKYVLEYDNAYMDTISKYKTSNIYFSCNLLLARRKWFDKYCEFAFGVAEKIDLYYKSKKISRCDRYMGYIFENLLSIFVMRYYSEMNVVCTEVEWGNY